MKKGFLNKTMTDKKKEKQPIDKWHDSILPKEKVVPDECSRLPKDLVAVPPFPPMMKGFLNENVSEKKKEKKQLLIDNDSDDTTLGEKFEAKPLSSCASANTANQMSQLPKDLYGLRTFSAPDQWSQLPQHLVDIITKQLNLDDLIRFSCVCRYFSWLSSFLLPPKCNPWLIVPVSHSNTKTDSACDKTLGFFSLYNSKVYKVETQAIADRRICGSSPGGWLITVHENGEIQVLHPFSKVAINLPPITKLPDVVSSKMKKKKLMYTVRMTSAGMDSEKLLPADSVRDSYIYKVIMSTSDPATATVMSIQGHPKKLAFYRPGKDSTWSLVKGDANVRLADVIFYRGKFYAAQNSGQVFVVGGLDSPSPVIESTITRPYPLASDRHYLVESSGELLLVMRTRFQPMDDFDLLQEDIDPDQDPDSIYRTTSFIVSKLDVDRRKWVEIYDLGGDCALFLGFNQSFSLLSSEFPGCKANSIYFTDDYVENYIFQPFGGHDIGVYDLQRNTVKKCYPSDALLIKPPPVWFTTNSC